MTARFAGRIVLVTGGGNGIGAAIARRLTDEGATVAVLDLDESADAVAAGIGDSAFAIRADVADAGQVGAAFASLVQRFGRIDVVANNAGVSGGSVPFHELTDDTFDTVMSVNLRGAFLVLRESLNVMLRQGHGAIVNTGSIGSFRATRGAGAYITSKGGILMMTRQAAHEYADKGVRVNAVCPGTIETRLVERAPRAIHEELIGQIPMGRFGRAEEIAAAVAFLASDDASYVTGEALVVDGGRNAG